jgi:hypothetical protein
MSFIADEPLYEVVNDQRVEIAPMGAHESLLASVLAFFLQLWSRPRRLGQAGVEVLFDLAPVNASGVRMSLLSPPNAGPMRSWHRAAITPGKWSPIWQLR